MDSRKRPPGNEIDLTNIVNGPRAKRSRVTYNEEDADVEMQDSPGVSADYPQPDSAVIKQGMRLWNAVKNFKDPLTGRELSYDFMKLVPRKFYPDYYKVIARPMALDNVKSRLELNGYPSVESVMADLELIFENAKAYNVEGSGIYSDAADLHAVLIQEYRTMTGASVERNENQDALEKLITETTNEMCAATDENGTNLAFHFMELPDGRLYPDYYQFIHKTMCFNHILRKIPRHEYTTATSWGQDVELIFQNAATYNEDASVIVTQAKALQLLYNNLVERFPPEFPVEKSVAVKPNVVKIKVGRPKKSPMEGERALSATPIKARAVSSNEIVPEVKIKTENITKAATPPPAAAPPGVPQTPTNVPVSVKREQPPQTPVTHLPPPQTPFRAQAPPTPITVSRPAPYPTQTRPYGYPPQMMAPQIPPGPPFQASFVLGPPTPLPEGMMKSPVTSVALRTIPMGRLIWLDSREGVSSWSIRLSKKKEEALRVESVVIEDEDGDPNDEDFKDETPEEPKPKRRGRPPTRSLAAQNAMMNGNGHVKKVAAIEYLRGLVIKLNGKLLLPTDEKVTDPTQRQWNVELSAGASVLDIGSWRVYVDHDGPIEAALIFKLFSTMSVAPPMGKELASAEKKTRDNAVKVLRDFLATTCDKPMSDLEMAKLWKGIFYCFWLSDKPLVQQELSTSLADLLLVIPTKDASFQFLRGFWHAIVREWSGLDYLRIDKYYMLVRKYVNASFRLLIREEWTLLALAEYTTILTGKGGPLNPEDRKVPTSIAFHLADIYNEELNIAMSCEPAPLPVPLVPLFKPFFKLDAVSPVSATHPRLQSSLYSPMLAALLAHSAPPDKARNYRSTVTSPALSSRESDGSRRKRARIEPPELPLISICRNARLGDDEDQENVDGQDGPEEETIPAPLAPEKVRKGLLKAMFEIASADSTKEANRKKMYREWKEATELAEEVAPMDQLAE